MHAHLSTSTAQAVALATLAALWAGCTTRPVEAPAQEHGRAPDAAPAPASTPSYQVLVTNETSGDLTVIDSATRTVVATIALGKRPRGVKMSADGTRAFVALSGSPLAPPGTDESKLPPADKKADGIGIVDLAARKVVTVLQGGSDPEELAVSRDGTRVYVANEDTSSTSVIDVASGKIVASLKVGGEPEGVTMSPDGRWVYVTSEDDGDVSVIDTAAGKVVKRFEVGPRPRASAFSPDASRAYVTSENGGTVAVVDTSTHTVIRTITLTGELVRPMGVVVSPDGKRAYVSTGRGGTVCRVESGLGCCRATLCGQPFIQQGSER